MLYRVEDIERDVRVALDQNEVDSQLADIGDIDTLQLNELIRSKIEQAVDSVESVAPLKLLESGHNFGEELYWEGNGIGFVLLPDDFRRLVSFKMSDWDMAVYSPIGPEHPLYGRQRSAIAAVRGNVHHPVCAIVPRAEGMALEFFASRDENAAVVQAVYIPRREIDKEGRIDFSEKCYDAVVAYVAAMVLMALGSDAWKGYVELSKTLMQ